MIVTNRDISFLPEDLTIAQLIIRKEATKLTEGLWVLLQDSHMRIKLIQTVLEIYTCLWYKFRFWY